MSLTSAARAQSKVASRHAAGFTTPWYVVFADSELTIALDTSRVSRVDSSTYRLWLKTRWAAPRNGTRKHTSSPFNREMIRTYLRCSPVAYKVIGTVVSLDDGPPLDSMVVGDRRARLGAWNVAKPRSADVGAGENACRLLHRRPGI